MLARLHPPCADHQDRWSARIPSRGSGARPGPAVCINGRLAATTWSRPQGPDIGAARRPYPAGSAAASYRLAVVLGLRAFRVLGGGRSRSRGL